MIDIEMEPIIKESSGYEALKLAFYELHERYVEAEQELRESPDDKFKSGRSLAFFEILEVINNRIAIVNSPYGDDDEDDEYEEENN